MLVEVDGKHSNEAFGLGDVTLRKTVALRNMRYAERVLKTCDLSDLVPNIVVELGPTVGME